MVFKVWLFTEEMHLYVMFALWPAAGLHKLAVKSSYDQLKMTILSWSNLVDQGAGLSWSNSHQLFQNLA